MIYLARLSKGEELAGLRLIKDNMAALVLKDIMNTRRHAYTVTGYEAINRFFEFLESEITKTYSNSKQHVIDQAKSEASFLRKLEKILLKIIKLFQTNNSDIELTIRYRYQRRIQRLHVHSLYDDIEGRPVMVNGEIILGLGDPVTVFSDGNFTLSSEQGSTTHSRYVDSDDSTVVKILPGEIVASHFCYPHRTPDSLQEQSRDGGLLLSLALVEHIEPENK